MVLNSKINTIIIEDNQTTQQYLASILTKSFNRIDIKGYADSIEKSIQLIEVIKPDLVFMDIELIDGYSF